MAALRAARLGQLHDEGTRMGLENDRYVVLGCDITVRVSNVDAALVIIRRVLSEASAPAATTSRVSGDPPRIHDLNAK